MKVEVTYAHENPNLPLTPQLGSLAVSAQIPSREAYDDTVHRVVAEMDTVMSYYYYNPDVTATDRQAALQAYETAIPSMPALFHALNIPEIPAINIEASTAFRKEDIFPVSIDDYRIGIDEDKSEWMLKNDSHDTETKTPKLEALMAIERMQDEVYAARIGHAVGYPLADTRIVQQDQKPWLAVRYMPTVRDHWMRSPGERNTHPYKGIAPRLEYMRMRPIFNALINAQYDGAKQGLIDQTTGEYFAMDTGIWLPTGPCIETDDSIVTQIMENMKKGCFGPFKMPADIRPMRDGIQHALNEGALRTIFDDHIGNPDRPKQLADHIEQRARALLGILDGPKSADFEYAPDFAPGNTPA